MLCGSLQAPSPFPIFGEGNKKFRLLFPLMGEGTIGGGLHLLNRYHIKT